MDIFCKFYSWKISQESKDKEFFIFAIEGHTAVEKSNFVVKYHTSCITLLDFLSLFALKFVFNKMRIIIAPTS